MNIVCVPSRTLNNRVGRLGLDPDRNEPILEAVNSLNDGDKALIITNKSKFDKAFGNVDPNTSLSIWTKLTEDYPCSTH